jgi:hypothetical protein
MARNNSGREGGTDGRWQVADGRRQTGDGRAGKGTRNATGRRASGGLKESGCAVRWA